MKCFACQPDSHNAFGSITNGVLTYFTVDCPRYQRHGVAKTTAGSSGQPSTPSTTPNLSAAAGSETQVHVQTSLTLPSGFQTSTCCFSMANRTIFGVDMVFVGASNGLLGLAVLQDKLLLYVQGKDPKSLQETLPAQRGGAASSSSARGGSQASHSPSMAHGPFPQHRSTNVSAEIRPTRRATPSTITWMRDKPLIFVGYTSGVVEWYRVAISPAKQHQLRDPSKEVPYGAAMPASTFAHQAMNRESRAQIACAMLDGEVDGIRIEVLSTCVLPGSGTLISSDYFPANGTVAVGGERGVVYLFHTDQLDAPLCQLTLASSQCAFVYCHPFQPLIGVLSHAVWTGRETPGRPTTKPLLSTKHPCRLLPRRPIKTTDNWLHAETQSVVSGRRQCARSVVSEWNTAPRSCPLSGSSRGALCVFTEDTGVT